jgi:hypothetical protein
MPDQSERLQIERRNVRSVWIVLALAFISQTSVGQVGRIEPLPALTNATVPDAIRQLLAPKGDRIFPHPNSPALEIWFRKELPAQPKPAASDTIYDRLAESTFVGVLRADQPFQDYRGQSIAAGFYTLRYVLMPNDGNHLGVAPSRDFLLLIPVTVDPGAEKILKFQDLVAFSRQASGTKHPAPMSLVQADGGGALIKDDEGHVVFTTAIHLTSGEAMPLSLVVHGTAPQ